MGSAGGRSAELATFRYAIYVDGTRSDRRRRQLRCDGGPAASPVRAACPRCRRDHTRSSSPPSSTPTASSKARSPPPLRVTVTGSTSRGDRRPAPAGRDRHYGRRRQARPLHCVADGLNDVVDFAITPDDRIVVAERAGRVRIVEGASVADALATVPASPLPTGRSWPSRWIRTSRGTGMSSSSMHRPERSESSGIGSPAARWSIGWR